MSVDNAGTPSPSPPVSARDFNQDNENSNKVSSKEQKLGLKISQRRNIESLVHTNYVPPRPDLREQLKRNLASTATVATPGKEESRGEILSPLSHSSIEKNTKEGQSDYPLTASTSSSAHILQSFQPTIQEENTDRNNVLFDAGLNQALSQSNDTSLLALATGEQPKTRSLNPKLTKKKVFVDYSEAPRPELRDTLKKRLANEAVSEFDETEAEIRSFSSDKSRLSMHATMQLQPPTQSFSLKALSSVGLTDSQVLARKSLLHTGKWVPAVYNFGKLSKDSAVWTCCGVRDQMSLYCRSVESREIFQKEKEQTVLNEQNAAEYAKFVSSTRKGPWERQEIQAVLKEEENYEQILMQNANSETSTLNGPMIISWTHKNMSDPLIAEEGLRLLLSTLQTGEGCVQFCRHEGTKTIMKAISIHSRHKEITLSCLELWKQLLDCNFTRDALINDTIIQSSVFEISIRFMKSEDHIRFAMSCLMQCSRSEICRLAMIEQNYLGYFTIFCKTYSRIPDILRYVLKTFNWVATTDERLIMLFDNGSVNTAVECMKRHISDTKVLAPSILLLTRVASIHLPAADYIVRKKAIPLIINALRALYSNELLQVEGLKMLRTLSQSEEGWTQISNMRGGWQSITQGTAVGDALIHDLPGYFHNPGWCIGDTPHLPFLERRKLEVAALSAASNSQAKIKTKGAWTGRSLQQFMGLNMKETKLSINNEEPEVYFEVVGTLDLLPNPKEEKEEWYARVIAYEKENGIEINQMVAAIIGMRRKKRMEEKEALKELKNTTENEYVKPVYFMGKLYDQKEMEESDKNLSEHLNGVV